MSAEIPRSAAATSAAREAEKNGAVVAYVWCLDQDGKASSEMIAPRNMNVRHLGALLQEINKHLAALQDTYGDHIALNRRLDAIEKAIDKMEKDKS